MNWLTKLFSKFSISKRETDFIGSLKGVCGIKYIHLITETIKILGVHFPCNQKSQIQKRNC